MEIRTILIRSRRLLLPLLLLTAGLVLGACGVTGPDESPWQDVAAYSWPTREGTFMRYRVEVFYPTPVSKSDSISNVTIERSDETFGDRTLYRVHDAPRPLPVRILFSPSHDTLYVRNEEFGGNYHLVGPLERGHRWISGYSDDAQTVPSWEATIVERLKHLQLKDSATNTVRQYSNVVVVKYELLDTTSPDYGSFWLRYYAEGQGPIQTIRHISLRRDQSGNIPTIPVEPQPITRSVLIESTPANN